MFLTVYRAPCTVILFVLFRPESSFWGSELSFSGLPAQLNAALQPHRRWDSTGDLAKAYSFKYINKTDGSIPLYFWITVI
jgi:hypothetical protein